MEAPILSVVIPTHKRPQILQQCLEHIQRQTVADQIEVIIVNDGEELRIDSSINSGGELRMNVMNVSPCHQGTARNHGVQRAMGKYVLFIGDDIFLAPDACEKHMEIHNSISPFPSEAGDGRGDWGVGVLGFTTWDPAVRITPVMTWLEKSGWQFGYPTIRPYAHSTIPSSIQHKFTYTSHISFPTEIARKFPFREDVTLYGWEDVEWGWRLQQAGIPLFYELEARALHHHHTTMEDSLKRMETLGRSAVVMERLVPELKLVPLRWKWMQYRIAALLPGMRGGHARAFLRGMTES